MSTAVSSNMQATPGPTNQSLISRLDQGLHTKLNITPAFKTDESSIMSPPSILSPETTNRTVSRDKERTNKVVNFDHLTKFSVNRNTVIQQS